MVQVWCSVLPPVLINGCGSQFSEAFSPTVKRTS
jgi:hypothetical protein